MVWSAIENDKTADIKKSLGIIPEHSKK